MTIANALGTITGIPQARDVNWTSVIIAGLLGATALAATLALTGTNLIKMLGITMAGAGVGESVQYIVGGMAHAMIGVGYSFVYAIWFAPLKSWNKSTKGIIVGIAIAALALALVPLIFLVFGATDSRDTGPFANLINVLNHIVYGVVVAFTYKSNNSPAVGIR